MASKLAPSSKEDMEHIMNTYRLDAILDTMADIARENGTRYDEVLLRHFAGVCRVAYSHEA